MSFVYAERQAADLTVSTTTLTNTELVFSIGPNQVYAIDLYALCTSILATTGYGFAITPTVPVTHVSLSWYHASALTGTAQAGFQRASGAVAGYTAAVDAANQLVPIIGRGLLVAGGQWGTARLQFRPEVAASATFKAGSVLRVMQV